MKELQNPDTVFETIISLVVRMAEHGLIHCDFNEFNIMVWHSFFISVYVMCWYEIMVLLFSELSCPHFSHFIFFDKEFPVLFAIVGLPLYILLRSTSIPFHMFFSFFFCSRLMIMRVSLWLISHKWYQYLIILHKCMLYSVWYFVNLSSYKSNSSLELYVWATK